MSSRATGAPRSLHLLCAIALLLAAPARSSAQAIGAEAGTARPAITSASDTEVGQLNLLVGRSTIINIGQPIARVSLTRPEVADAMVTGTQQLLVHGKLPGTISMFVWDRSGGIKRYDVTVARDLSQLTEQLRQLFPGESIAVTGNGKDVVVSGTVSSKYVVEKVVDVAAGYVEKKEDVVNLLRQQEGVASNQVLLRVRFAEVSRSALTELGASFFTGAGGYKNYVARTTTEQFAAPNFDNSDPNKPKLVFSDFLNLFLFNNKEGLGGVIHALQNKGLFQSLAEPNLVAENGKEASFLAGGEYPYPVVQGTGSNLAVTIVFKEYGIRLNFLPTLMGGDLIHLKVRPEVSSLDFTNAITYQGFRIPALSTRRADTEVELMDGQTFAIAGLIDNTVTSTMQKIPGIGDIPILGLLFRSKAMQKAQSELVVMITPQILRKGSMGAATGLPNMIEPYMPGPNKTLSQPAPKLPGGPPRDQATSAPVQPPAADDPPAASVPPAPAAAPRFSPATPAPAVAEPAPVAAPVRPEIVTPAVRPVTAAPAPAPAAAPARSVAVTAPAPPPAPKIDEKKLAEERKAAAKEADRKREEDRKAEERAAKALKQQQEAEGRELARQRELDTKQKEAEAKAAAIAARAAEERRRAEAAQAAVRAEAQRQAEAKQAEEQRKADIRRAEEQVKAEAARLETAKKEADEARKVEEKASKERAKRDADAAKVSAELERKQVEAEKKRLKDIQDATDRLNAAQAAYQAACGKTKK